MSYDEGLDITYCAAEDCPLFDCERNLKNLEGLHVIISMADFSPQCGRYIRVKEAGAD